MTLHTFFNRAKSLLAVALVLSTVSIASGEEAPGRATNAIDPTLPSYNRVSDLQGNLSLVGSSTMSHVAAIWGDGFRRMYPDVEIEVNVKGSANAVPSVINGSANIGLLSRTIEEAEVKAFHDRFGYVPTILTPVLEPIAIYVHKDNPIESVSLAQLDALFSTSLKRGEPKTAKTWGDVGVSGKWATVAVQPYGRSDDTGSQVYFQSVILGSGEFRSDLITNPTNVDLIQAIEKDPRAIGFAGSTYETAQVKTVPVSWKTGAEAVGVHDVSYPLFRQLQLVVNNDPNRLLNPVEREFIRYVFSSAGQQDVVIAGYLPIPAGVAQIALQAVGEKTLN